jgi:hypothetical protein
MIPVKMIVITETIAAACRSLMSVSGIKYHYETEHCSPCPESVLFHVPSLLSFLLIFHKYTVSA